MLEIYVGPEGNFSTISEALLAISYNTKATLYLAAGIYEEKIFCEKKNITFIGAGPDKTIIKWNDYANKPHPDGRKYGTFRSYTAFFAGRVVTVKDLTILNTSGDNKIVGQAIAAYVDAEVAHFTNVHFDSYQDTLFCAPLPDIEHQVGGFLGPRMHTLRHSSFQFYHNCKIAGNVDFIFGGGDVLFHDCEINSKALFKDEIGYVAAPSGKASGAGFVFTGCRFTSETASKGSVFFARPWREEAKVALLNCYLGDHIHEAGFSPWNAEDTIEKNSRTTFIEHLSYGPGANTTKRISWIKKLDSEASKSLNMRIEHATIAWGIGK